MRPSPAQIEAYRRDGFVIVPEFAPASEVERARAHFALVFEHRWETGVAPDEVNYEPGVTPADKTRQLCNVWRADRTLAATTLAARNAELAAGLEGVPGMRLLQDNAIWKPASGRALLAHRDASYCGWLDPVNMTTSWVALDDTHADTGTIYYVPGSHLWPRTEVGGQFHAPDDWLGHMRSVMPEGTEPELVPIEVPAGGAAFHHGWVFHGSPPNARADRERRALISHMGYADTRHHDTERHPVYSRYLRPGSTELDEAFFPVMWREDGYRTPFLDDYVAGPTPGPVSELAGAHPPGSPAGELASRDRSRN